MPSAQARFLFARLREAAVIFAFGAAISASGGGFSAGPCEISGHFTLSAAAMAGEADSGQGRDEEGKKGGKRGSKSDSASHPESEAPAHPGGMTYEAGRNMLRLHLNLGAGHDSSRSVIHLPHTQHEGPAWTVGRGGSPEHEAKALNDVYLRNIASDGWGEMHSAAALEKSVNPVEERYRSSVFRPTGPITTVEKTKLPIGGLPHLPNEILAIGVDAASIGRAEALGFKAGQPLISGSSDHTIVQLTVPPGLDAVRAQELLSREMPGDRFELNKVYRLYRAQAREDPVTFDKTTLPLPPGNAPSCDEDRCFARQAIHWTETLSPCARGLKVGVIDTDIDESHPAFKGRNIHRFDFSPDGRLAAQNWHGTAVLSLLAGSPLTGTPGLIPDAEFFAANVFFSDERGEMAADTLSVVKALDWMKAYGVKLINMSFSGPRDGLVSEAIERMSENGVIFVAAAGNEGPTAQPSYPAAYPQVVAVTAVTKDLRNYRYANRGDHIDVAAPGVDIWTAMPGGRGGYHSGTSFAAPHVTAVLAVEPPEALQQEKAALLDSLDVMDLGQQGRDPIYGRGLLLAPGTCTPPPSETLASASAGQ
jgi:hypothetical protein